jgi:hypothetical protein
VGDGFGHRDMGPQREGNEKGQFKEKFPKRELLHRAFAQAKPSLSRNTRRFTSSSDLIRLHKTVLVDAQIFQNPLIKRCVTRCS